MESIKVLQVYNVDTSVKIFLLPLIDRLSKEGSEVWTVCPAVTCSEELKNKGYNIKNIRIDRKIFSFANILAIFKIANFIKKNNFDIVHVHTPIASVIGRLAAKLAGTPIVIYTAHGFYFHKKMNKLKYNFYVTVEKIMGKYFTDYIFTQSDEDRLTAIDEEIMGQNRITTIGNGVNSSKFNPDSIELSRKKLREGFGLKESDNVVCFIGRLVKEKGIIELIEAFKVLKEELVDSKLLIVGDSITDRDSETKDLIKHMVESYNLKNDIIFTGYRDDVPELLHLSDLFVLPSYREGMPRSIIEAMMMAKPVVATDIRGCREEVEDGKTGYLVEVNNSTQLFKAIYKILSNDKLKYKMGKLGQERALRLFDEEKVLDRQMAIFNQLSSKI